MKETAMVALFALAVFAGLMSLLALLGYLAERFGADSRPGFCEEDLNRQALIFAHHN
jgi:hypothetical protein